MKEKLIELLNAMIDENKDKNITTEVMADYLIQNGVLVPPCKVGDTVYAFCEYWGVVLPYFVETLEISYYNKNENCYLYEANCTNAEQTDLLDSIDFDFDDIGKTVFLTKEEAEKKLKECENENNV